MFLLSQDIPRHSVGLEIGGPGLVYTVNYQYHFNSKWSGRLGTGFLRIQENETEKSLNFFVIPLELKHSFDLSQNGAHLLILGLGLQNIIGSGDIVSNESQMDVFINPFLSLGYQFNFKNGLYLQANFTPFYGTRSLTRESGFFELYDPLVIDGTTIHIWGGIGFGYRFLK